MLDKLRGDTRGQAMDLPTVAIVLVVAGVVGFIGILVMSEVISTANLSSGDPLYSSQEGLVSAVDSAWGLYGVAFIVVILAVIVTYLYGIRGSGGNGGRR